MKDLKSYGHSMVIDPWGDVIGQMSDREGSFVCELDLKYLDDVRGNMLCLNQVMYDSTLRHFTHK